VSDALAALAARIDRLARRPADARVSSVPLYIRVSHALGWKPRISTGRLAALIDHISLDLQPVPGSKETPAALYRRALEELDDNVSAAEWALALDGRPPDGWCGWLWRCGRTLRLAGEYLEGPHRREVLRAALADVGDRAAKAVPTGAEARLARAVDATIDAAFAETRFLGRQRRLLEAARQLLLGALAAGTIDGEGGAVRGELLARRIARLDRIEAAGASADVDLMYQATEALARGERFRLYVVLAALEEAAANGGDDALSGLAGDALGCLDGGAARASDAASRRSLQASCFDVFSDEVRAAVTQAYGKAPANLAAVVEKVRRERPQDFELDAPLFEDWARYLQPSGVAATLAASLAVGGCFDLGFAAAPARARGGRSRDVLVRHPTERLRLEAAEGLDDLPRAVITDPRTLMLDLAAGRLLAQRYVEGRAVAGRGGGHGLAGEARVYVLDGSSSMLGARSRMRDAILVAELATLANRWRDAERLTNPVLFYRYFNDQIGPTHRVATPEEALAAIEQVLAGVRYGGTDIQGALLASFEQVRLAREDDPELASAQIVLVTDGDATIDEPALREARERAGDLPIGVSIIALGLENPALKRLAAEQHARGERVFYQFVDDAALRAVVQGRTAGLAIHPPAEARLGDVGAEFASLVDEIGRRGRVLDVAAIERDRARDAALHEVGLASDATEGLGESARRAARERDALGIERAFRRAFPDTAVPENDASRALARLREQEDALAAVAAVAEVVGALGGEGLERKADAVEILERLLVDAGLPPWRYEALVAAPTPALAAALRAVHDASAGARTGCAPSR
jgi:hypothetical protein